MGVICRGIGRSGALAVMVLLLLWGTAWTAVYGTEPPAEAVITNIGTVEELMEWYQEKGQVGILSKDLVIDRSVVLGPAAGQAKSGQVQSGQAKSGQAGSGGMEVGSVELRIPDNKSLRIVTRGSLVINNPDLVIRGSHHLLTVEGTGSLTLKQGCIEAGARNEPAIVLKDHAVMNRGNGFKPANLVIRDERVDAPETEPDSSGQSGQGMEPDMTEAVLLSLDSEGNGSARLEFADLPSDINALYIFRSRDGKSWTKEKNKLSAASSQGGQGMVEYENFLKESGNTLSTSIVEDEYLIYSFRSAYESFYVKARFEWPGGELETEKIKLAVPEYVGQGNEVTFSYSGSRQGPGYRGYYSNLGGQLTWTPSYNPDNPPQEETDAPEAPARGGGGRNRRDFYPPYDARPGYDASGQQPEKQREPGARTASPSSAGEAMAGKTVAGETMAGEAMAGEAGIPDSGTAPDAGDGTIPTEPGAEAADSEQTEDSGQEEADGPELRFRKICVIAGLGTVLLLGVAAVYVHKRRGR